MVSVEEPPSSNKPLESVINGTDIWHALEASNVVRALRTSPDAGLSSTEAEKRAVELGPNELEEADRPSLFQMILEQFNNFIVIVLIVAAILSAV